MSIKFLLPLLAFVNAATAEESVRRDVEYARVGEHVLKLDLHLPKEANPPLVVYVHGGAWRSGTKSDLRIAKLLDHGFAIASVDYRLSTQAVFPAQVHDIKAAIRFLRAKSGEFQINGTRIGVIGSSAGGHLAALAGVTNDHQLLEGEVGKHLDESSKAQCIVSLYGASNLQSILSQSTEFGLKMRVPALQLLLGGQPDEKADLAKLASPTAHVDAGDPPLLLIHGDADPQMPPQQSEEFSKAYEAAKLSSQIIIIPGGKHGGAEFYDEERTGVIAKFLTTHLGSR
jgi:acetyl esterase/lipase